jgi:hypothetical protein
MTAFYAPKRDSLEREWEDAAAYDERTGVCAVADGAGSSYRAARWSATLVESFRDRTPAKFGDRSAFHGWVQQVADDFQSRSEAVSDATWYTSDASRRGSFATFAGIQLKVVQGALLFDGVCVGDACVFQTRSGEFVKGTIQDPAVFNSTPDLLSSSPYQDSYGAEKARFITNVRITPGDTLFLASDAFSAAALRLHHAGKPVWKALDAMGLVTFEDLVRRMRAAEVMEDDDVTLLRVRTGGIGT